VIVTRYVLGIRLRPQDALGYPAPGRADGPNTHRPEWVGNPARSPHSFQSKSEVAPPFSLGKGTIHMLPFRNDLCPWHETTPHRTLTAVA